MSFRNNIAAPAVGVALGVGTFLLTPTLGWAVAGTVLGIIGDRVVRDD